MPQLKFASLPKAKTRRSYFFFARVGGGALPRWLSRWNICLQCKRHRLDLCVGQMLWRRAWQPAPVFLPGESHGQRSLAGYSPWGRKESDTTEGTEHACWHYSFEVVWWCLGWRTENSTCYWAQTPAPGPSWPFPIIFILHLVVQGSLDCLAETPVLALASPSALPRGICRQEKALWALSLNLNPNTLVALWPPAVPLLSWCPFLTRKWGRHT